jgi:hypothetical protein
MYVTRFFLNVNVLVISSPKNDFAFIKKGIDGLIFVCMFQKYQMLLSLKVQSRLSPEKHDI